MSIARDIVDRETWPDLLAELGPVSAAALIRRIIKQIGHQEAARVESLTIARDEPDADYEITLRNFKLWRRSTQRLRADLNARLAEIRPTAQTIIDSHQADRRALVVLAKRIWLWEEGLDDQLETTLDAFTISNSADGEDRITLRQLIQNIRDSGAEVTP